MWKVDAQFLGIRDYGLDSRSFSGVKLNLRVAFSWTWVHRVVSGWVRLRLRSLGVGVWVWVR
jgi:hypothetical protein